MVDRENREDWKRERSLLALGQAVRGEEDVDASLVSIGDRTDPSWREDAATRHRLARSRREARAQPIPTATGEAGQPGADQQFTAPQIPAAQTEQTSGLAGLLPGWLGGKRPNDSSAELLAAETDPTSYAQTAPQPQPASANAFGTAQSDVAAEPRYASEEHPFREDTQQWKPLIDPMQVVRGVARSKALIVTTTILGAALGIAIALSTPKKYEATTELVIAPGDLKLSDRDLTQSVGQPDAALAVVETRIKMLTSGNVLNKVVDQLKLVDNPEFNGQGSGGLGVMSLIRSILSRQDGPGGADEVRRRALAVRNLAESLSVERTGKTFVVSISATTQDGEMSALIATTVGTVFQQETGQYQSDMAVRATEALTSKLDELRKNVEAAERKVEDFRATHGLVDAQGHLISDDQMLKLNEQLSVARARTLELNARAASARSIDVNSVLTGTLPEEINSNTMSDLRSQYATLKQEAARAAVRLGPRHPELQALDAQIAGARELIAAELRRIASSLQVDLKRAVQLEQDLASRLAQAKVQSGDVNSDLVTMRELEREAAAKRSVYEQYLLRSKETGEQKNINTANIDVLTPAVAPLEAKGPSRAVIALAGLLLGLASGVGLGVMRGAYESLRETANSRSRRGTEERRTPFEDKAYQAAPPSVRPIEAARTGRLAGLLSVFRKTKPGKAHAEKFPDTLPSQPISPAVAAKPMAPQQPGYAPPPPQGAYAPLPRQTAEPPLTDDIMPRQATYPAYPATPYPYPQQAGYPHAQSWQMQPPAGYTYPQATAPYAGPAYYPQQPAPLQAVAPRQDAYPWDPSASPASDAAEQQTPIEEIRASLREFREAVQELTESRARRRYF
ncbi:succinoglycan biosynthesis protein exop [Mesorhizobium sp. PAMC28654]|uniref:GumC family protein n=1 Tax=Mesorhizobium sp. PAMC28654 TaxID=2880934 RepID=UPI001D0A30F0|nr:Wzz/FepE/Etk N-terminal domain-containing protein [Mesorhizobium sp. PAMC28654]UDL92164.1 succinoglycan biosynthesis protein exop [Mesorhizobium sp. PAMC28654]